MAWWNGPDPYTYERIGVDSITGRPVWLCSLDGVELGVIVPWRASTDTKITGTRLRRQGRGRDEFIKADDRYRISQKTRREIAHEFEREPMPADRVAFWRERYAKQPTVPDQVERLAESIEAAKKELVKRDLAEYERRMRAAVIADISVVVKDGDGDRG